MPLAEFLICSKTNKPAFKCGFLKHDKIPCNYNFFSVALMKNDCGILLHHRHLFLDFALYVGSFAPSCFAGLCLSWSSQTFSHESVLLACVVCEQLLPLLTIVLTQGRDCCQVSSAKLGPLSEQMNSSNT